MRLFRNKDRAPNPEPTPPAPLPRRHARTTQDPLHAVTTLPAEALTLTEPVRAWLANDIARLEAEAAKNEAHADRILADAAEWRTVAAGYRRILDLAEITALRAEQARLEREAEAYAHPHAPADVQEFAATWAPAEREDEPWGGEMLLPPATSSWGSLGASSDGLTAPLPLVNGELR